ncbi:MAG: hypothetical protein LQ344_004622 [Seirophora lacunosa]|nr:MAG: hypothetical protein LQ344_004622 [Seirophora lacunosa]
MNRYRIGRVSAPWVNFTPPIRGGKFSPSTSDGPPSTPKSLSIHAHASSRPSSVEEPTPEAKTFSSPPPPSPNEIPAGGADASQLPSKGPDNARIVKQALKDDMENYPSLDTETQQHIVQKYRDLHEEVKVGGYYDCRYQEYAKESWMVHDFSSASRAVLGMAYDSATNARDDEADAVQHQIMFTAHDAGHQGITHNFVIDTLIGMFIADFCCGLSMGWWKSSHNVHHLVTNHHEHDPDIQNAPLFAMSPSFLSTFHSSYYNFTFPWDRVAELAIPYQRYTYYPIMGIARFNLYLLSWCHLLSPRSKTLGAAAWTRPTEICFMLAYWFIFGYCLVWRSIPTWPLRIMFVLISHIITMPLHVQITLSHWAMSTSDFGEAESFPQHQLRTTMDVECPAWLDFIHGGLQFQAVHHLFPGVPRHNLRRLQQLVIRFCDETNIKYKRLSFVAGNKDVLGKLGEVANQLEMMIKCQKHMAETGESGLH